MPHPPEAFFYGWHASCLRNEIMMSQENSKPRPDKAALLLLLVLLTLMGLEFWTIARHFTGLF